MTIRHVDVDSNETHSSIKADQCRFNAFLEFVLEKVDRNTDSEPHARLQKTLDAVLDICNDDKEFRMMLTDYCQEVAGEGGSYASFIKIFNEALLRLKAVTVAGSKYRPADPIDILFCRNAERHTTVFRRTKPKPDIILTSQAAACRAIRTKSLPTLLELVTEQPPQEFTWDEVLASWELKVVEEDPALDPQGPVVLDEHAANELLRPAVVEPPAENQKERAHLAAQAALYGAEMLSRGPAASHAISVVIVDSMLRVWWYDREGAIQTDGIDFLTDLPRFLVLLFALQRFSLEDWGFILGLGGIDALKNEGMLTHPAPITLQGGQHGYTVSVDTSDIVHWHRTASLNSRATCIFASTCSTLGTEHPLYGQPLVTKFSWGESTRVPEGEVIARISSRADGDPMITERIPQVVFSMQYDLHNTGTVRRKLRVPLRKLRRPHGNDESEVEVYRVLQVMTMRRLEPIHALVGEDFICAWLECARAHYLIWLKDIHHRDLSLKNLMFYRDGDNRPRGVVNDWDFACDTQDLQTHTGLELTGTMPFMAIDLLTNAAFRGEVRHMYRHDLESVFWILIWVVSCIEDGKQIDPLPEMYQEWTSGHMRTCCNSKRTFLSVGWKYSGGGPRPTWSAEGNLARAVLYYFTKTQVARDMQALFGRNTAPVEEMDEPEKVWDEFCAVIREVGRAHPSLGYLVDFS